MHRSAHWLRTTTIIASAVVSRPAIPTVPWPLLLSLSTILFVWRQQEQLLVERPQAESINRMLWHEEARRRARGLSAASPGVGHEARRQYVSSLALAPRGTGVAGLGFVA